MTDYRKFSKASLIEELQRLQAAAQSERAQDHQVRHLHHDLQVHQIELEMQNRELLEKERELQVTLDKYADLYDFAPVGYLTLDGKGVIRNINLTAAQLLGRPRGQLLGYPLMSLLVAGYSRDCLNALRRALDSDHEQTVDLQLKNERTGGGEVQLRMRAQDGGAPASVRAAMLDVTAQRRVQREARRHLEQAARLQRLQSASELATMLAHELNQPLAAIAMLAGASRYLLDQAPPDAARLGENLDRIAEMALGAGDIIRRLRQFVSNGQIESVSLDLNAAVTNACTLLRASAEHSGIRLTLDLCEPAPAVTGAPVQIEQVLLNLLRNAVEAVRGTGAGSGDVQVLTRQQDNTARVTVHDSGPGVDAATAVKLFNPFESNKEDGLGVGLHISHSLIEAHGGRLWVEPHTPGGVFHFELPLSP